MRRYVCFPIRPSFREIERRGRVLLRHVVEPSPGLIVQLLLSVSMGQLQFWQIFLPQHDVDEGVLCSTNTAFLDFLKAEPWRTIHAIASICPVAPRSVRGIIIGDVPRIPLVR